MRLVHLSIAFLLVSTGTGWAHHSFAAFDLTKTARLTGTVKDFQWTNPHSWLQIVTMDAKGKSSEWSLEMSAVSMLVRWGWRPQTLKPGDKIVLEIHPRRDGAPGGSLMSVTRSDGKQFKVPGMGGGTGTPR